MSTVRGRGWAGLRNGALMKEAAAVCDVFITMDKNIQHQQHVPGLPFGVILLTARSNRMLHLVLLIADLHPAIAESRPGKTEELNRAIDSWNEEVGAFLAVAEERRSSAKRPSS